MKKNLLDLVTDLIEQNQKEFDYYSSIGLTEQMEFYAGKLAAYRIIESYASDK
jgi:hypothetical protein